MSQKEKHKGDSTISSSSSGIESRSVPNEGKDLPYIIGPDGKPCRACTDFKSWAKQMKGDVVGRSVPSMASAVSLQLFISQYFDLELS